MKHFIQFRNGVIRVDSIDGIIKQCLLNTCYISMYVGSKEFNEEFSTKEELDKRYEELVQEIEEYYLSQKILSSINDVREQYGLNPIKGGDDFVIPQSLLQDR